MPGLVKATAAVKKAPVKQAATSGGNTARGNTPVKSTGSSSGGNAPPPPGPPPPPTKAPAKAPAASTTVAPPTVANSGPAGSLLVSLAIFNGYPFKDHWALIVRTSKTAQKGIMVHAAGDVKKGFTFEIKRNIDFEQTSSKPQWVDLQWVAASHFNQAMWNNGAYVVETPGHAISPFETSAAKAPAPQKTLNAVDDLVTGASTGGSSSNPPRRITQRNCQTWVVEAVEKLVADGILTQAVLTYVRAKKQ